MSYCNGCVIRDQRIDELKSQLNKDGCRSQRRYEIARDSLSALLVKTHETGIDRGDYRVRELYTGMAIQYADALLKALEESSDGE